MMNSLNKLSALIVIWLSVMMVSGCRTTSVSSSWRDNSFRKEGIRKVFIISHLKNELLRRKSEDAFAKEFRRYGVDSLQSYKFFENEKDTDKAEVRRRVIREGCTSVLVAKLLDEKSVNVDNRPMMCATPSEWNAAGWYQTYADVCRPSYPVNLDILRIETALFEAETDKLLWATQTHTEITSSPTDKDIEEWVRLAIHSMFNK